LNHDLLTAYPVLVEKANEFVAQFKCTVAVLPRSTIILAGDLTFAKERFESDKTINN
jgi:methionine aminopeptidase